MTSIYHPTVLEFVQYLLKMYLVSSLKTSCSSFISATDQHVLHLGHDAMHLGSKTSTPLVHVLCYACFITSLNFVTVAFEYTWKPLCQGTGIRTKIPRSKFGK